MRIMTAEKELIFGTGNKAKINQIQGALAGSMIIVKGVNEFSIDLPKIEEDGETAVENARKKAVTYARTIGRTVFSIDNALYFDGVSNEDQPGLHVRRIMGIEASTDNEMLQHYTEFLSNHGGQLRGWWEFAVSIARPDGTSAEDVIISHRQFVALPSESVIPGFPLESIQIDLKTGKYIANMTKAEQAKFWQDNIGEPLKAFVTANL